MGDYCTRFDAADHSLGAERKHGRDRFHHQFAAFAVCKYSFTAGGFATAVMATSRARCAGIVLRVVPDNVVVESITEINNPQITPIPKMHLCNL